jgi:hypothetical protein
MNRIYHVWDKWECYPAGFYENSKEGMTKEECETAYKDFLSDGLRFSAACLSVINTWKNSCEHYLTNEKMNRVAWMGQAAACLEMGIPSCYRAGYFKLTSQQQKEADLIALEYINRWLERNGYPQTDLEGAGVSANANIY